MARYELLERIGVGGMAEIFRGMAVAGGGFEKPVAIKRILPHLSKDSRFVELLITEAKTLSQLRHRNIVQIYDVGLGDDGQYFLVMEFVDGVDLGALYESLERRQRVLPIEVSLHIGSEICEALDHAHRVKRADGVPLGLVHRDVSPSNILLSRSGEVKLTDFGIAKRMEEVTGHGGVRGKFAYISPEQSHNTHVDARSDVFSCGIVLYELIVGKRLFSQMSDFDALRMVRESRVPRPRDVRRDLEPELETILLTALAMRPEDRFESAAAFSARLRSFRYSMESSLADPATELASAIALTQREPSSSHSLAPQSTVVRISTASGFLAEFAEDNQTLVARMQSSGGRAAAGHDLAGLVPLPRIEGERSGPIADEFDDAETRSVSFDAQEQMVSSLEDDAVTVTRMVDPVIMRERSTAAAPARLATLERTPPHTPAPVAIPIITSASPVLEEDRLFGVSRRRAILIVSGVAAVVAVVAFVIVGTLLPPEESSAGADSADPPAAVAPDAAASAVITIDAGGGSAAAASPVDADAATVKKKTRRHKKARERRRERERRDRDRNRKNKRRR